MKKSAKPIVVLYSTRKEHFVGIDPAGRPAIAKYEGARLAVMSRVLEVHLPKRSPSVALEDASVIFSIIGSGRVPGSTDATLIELLFDEHASPGTLDIGDLWEIFFTDKGELIDLRPFAKA
jgi:hypothetical protein